MRQNNSTFQFSTTIYIKRSVSYYLTYLFNLFSWHRRCQKQDAHCLNQLSLMKQVAEINLYAQKNIGSCFNNLHFHTPPIEKDTSSHHKFGWKATFRAMTHKWTGIIAPPYRYIFDSLICGFWYPLKKGSHTQCRILNAGFKPFFSLLLSPISSELHCNYKSVINILPHVNHATLFEVITILCFLINLYV